MIFYVKVLFCTYNLEQIYKVIDFFAALSHPFSYFQPFPHWKEDTRKWQDPISKSCLREKWTWSLQLEWINTLFSHLQILVLQLLKTLFLLFDLSKQNANFFLSFCQKYVVFCPPTLQHNIRCWLMDTMLNAEQSFIDIFIAIWSSKCCPKLQMQSQVYRLWKEEGYRKYEKNWRGTWDREAQRTGFLCSCHSLGWDQWQPQEYLQSYLILGR